MMVLRRRIKAFTMVSSPLTTKLASQVKGQTRIKTPGPRVKTTIKVKVLKEDLNNRTRRRLPWAVAKPWP